MPPEDCLFPALGHIPEVDRAIAAPRGQHPAIGAENHGTDRLRVPGQGGLRRQVRLRSAKPSREEVPHPRASVLVDRLAAERWQVSLRSGYAVALADRLDLIRNR